MQIFSQNIYGKQVISPHKLTAALADVGYKIHTSPIACRQMPLVILLMRPAENSDTPDWDMGHSDHRCDDWRSAVSFFFAECALLFSGHEMLSLQPNKETGS